MSLLETGLVGAGLEGEMGGLTSKEARGRGVPGSALRLQDSRGFGDLVSAFRFCCRPTHISSVSCLLISCSCPHYHHSRNAVISTAGAIHHTT